MEIINRRQRMASLTRKLRRENKTIGLVPTMGALHEGHLSLIREARQMSDVVIVSIFVNPTQFGKNEDYDKYPRDLTGDTAILTDYNIDYIFAPNADEIYPPGYSTFVYVEGLSEIYEGAIRPGHFRGVSTIVSILFNTIRPDFAFFGQKDAQQVAVIKRMTKDLAFETEIITLPTIREESGLAMSSRNAFLGEEEKFAATIIYKALREAKLAFRDGERNALVLTQIVRNRISTEPRAQLDYVIAANPINFETIDTIEDEPVIIAVAVRFGKVRLIDNMILNKK
jgi:pantoate--beta-alanine ligase